jgi:hypothetical protein
MALHWLTSLPRRVGKLKLSKDFGGRTQALTCTPNFVNLVPLNHILVDLVPSNPIFVNMVTYDHIFVDSVTYISGEIFHH